MLSRDVPVGIPIVLRSLEAKQGGRVLLEDKGSSQERSRNAVKLDSNHSV